MDTGSKMKPEGRHPEKRLTAIKVRASLAPGRYADGNGLYLVVEPTGSKRWVLRTVVQGKRRDMGLGGAGLVTLAEAREKALAYRKEARAGGDPFAIRAKASTTVPTFEAAARTVHADHKSTWKSEKHADQWINTLAEYVFPVFGTARVDQVESAHVLRALSPIWLTKPETARRVKQRIGTVLDWARAAGHRSTDNPVLSIAKGLPKQTDRDEHHAALPYAALPAFLQELDAARTAHVARLAFEFLIITAARTTEVLLAEPAEFDLDSAVWTVPAARMKMKREHRVPLSPRAVAIVREALKASPGARFVFPGRKAGKPLSSMVFLMVLRRMNKDITAHGFRSTFRDWAAERTSFPREVAEAALAHAVEDKVEAAYRRTDLFDLRRQMMTEWASFARRPQ
jgi:integrase